MDWLYWLQNSE